MKLDMIIYLNDFQQRSIKLEFQKRTLKAACPSKRDEDKHPIAGMWKVEFKREKRIIYWLKLNINNYKI